MLIRELPVDRWQRWDLLDRFIDAWFPRWYGEPGVAASELVRAEQRLGFSLPLAFCEWYARFGARRDVWSIQDALWAPHQLKVERDVLIFCNENQGVVQWGIRLEDRSADDPLVVVSDPWGGRAWFVDGQTTSAFAIQLAAINVKFSNAMLCSANGQGTDEALLAIDSSYPRLPFPDMHWPAWPTRIYGRDDILIETNGNTWIWVSARSEQAMAQLDALAQETRMLPWEFDSRIDTY